MARDRCRSRHRSDGAFGCTRLVRRDCGPRHRTAAFSRRRWAAAQSGPFRRLRVAAPRPADGAPGRVRARRHHRGAIQSPSAAPGQTENKEKKHTNETSTNGSRLPLEPANRGTDLVENSGAQHLRQHGPLVALDIHFEVVDWYVAVALAQHLVDGGQGPHLPAVGAVVGVGGAEAQPHKVHPRRVVVVVQLHRRVEGVHLVTQSYTIAVS